MPQKRCIVSYTYDSKAHNKWVSRLVSRIKEYEIDITIDQFDLMLSDNLDSFMNKFLEMDKIIIICTPNYVKKTTGGVAYEKSLISQIFKSDSTSKKFIVILRNGTKDTSIPVFLRNINYIDMTNGRILVTQIKRIIDAIKERNTMPQKQPSRKTESSANMKKETQLVSSEVRINIAGHSLIGGRGQDGIRYLWKDESNHYTESAAFNSRLKTPLDGENEKITSAYTCSVSFGCSLQNMNSSCCFCATGELPYNGILTASEIALQNIFMAEYDTACPSYPSVHDNTREFAFMGQGEPGFCYPQVRKSILLTDYAMEEIKQKVTRYIISTCGIPEFIDMLISDLKNGIFKNKVTFHFSLHAIDELRDAIMPINKLYSYSKTLDKTKELYDVTNEKIAVGILLFKNFRSKGNTCVSEHSTSMDYLKRVLNKLDPSIHRIDLCDVNLTRTISKQAQLSNELANELLQFVKQNGFEAKLFSSFGIENNTGCGMLSSEKSNIQSPGPTTIEHFNNSLELLRKAQNHLR